MYVLTKIQSLYVIIFLILLSVSIIIIIIELLTRCRMRKDVVDNKLNFSKIYYKEIIRIILLLLFAIAAILLDNIFNLNNDSFRDFTIAIFNSISTVAGIWSACYLVYFQLYCNRYPYQIIKDSNNHYMINIFIDVTYVILYGCVTMIINKGIIAPIWFSMVAIITVLEILLMVFKTKKSLFLNTYINTYFDKMKSTYLVYTKKDCNKTFSEIKKIFDESIIKEEYDVSQNITVKAGEIFRSFLRDSFDMDDNKNVTADDIFMNIVEFNIYQLTECKRVKSDLLIEHIHKQNYFNIEYCINNKQYEWFKKYTLSLFTLFFKLQKDNNDNLSNEISHIFHNVVISLIESDKPDWLKYFIDEIFLVTRELNFINENSNLKYFASLITDALLFCFDNSKEIEYIFLIKTFTDFTNMVLSIPKSFTDIKIYYAIYFIKLQKQSDDKITDFVKLLYESNNTTIKDSYWVEFKLYCLSELYSIKSFNKTKDIKEYHIKTLIEVIDLKDDYRGFLIYPNFAYDINESINNTDEVEIICKFFQRLFNRCILKDNISQFTFYLKEILNCFEKTKQSNSITQQKLFDLFIWCIERTCKLINKQFLESTFSYFEDSLHDLDSERKISTGFGNYIIKKMVDIASFDIHNNDLVTDNIINLLYSFLKENNELNFVNQFNMKKAVYKALFNIGTTCIENNYENGLRNVSNSMGWLIIYSIRLTYNRELTYYLIERANELYIISKNMEVSQKTLTFLLTLFTTIGTYCCKDIKLTPYTTKIIDCLSNDSIESIKTAIRLRTSENDVWNELYDEKTSDYECQLKSEPFADLNLSQ